MVYIDAVNLVYSFLRRLSALKLSPKKLSALPHRGQEYWVWYKDTHDSKD